MKFDSLPKLPKSKQVYDRDREHTLSFKNAHPFTFGYPSPIAIPGNEDGTLRVPCCPYDDGDGDRRWAICESFEQAKKFYNSYLNDIKKEDMESRCVFYKKNKKGEIRAYKCRKSCPKECPKCIECGDVAPDGTTPNYERTGKPLSLDFKYDEDDPEESEHCLPDAEGESPLEYALKLEEERRVEDLISQRDRLDREIIALLFEDRFMTERAIAEKLNLSKTATHCRLTKLREWVKTLEEK